MSWKPRITDLKRRLELDILLLLLSCLLSFSRVSAMAPIVPEDVLTPAEIRDIMNSRDFFFLQGNHNPMQPSWDRMARQYSSHLLKRRDLFFTMDEVIRKTLSDAFPIRYRVQDLYRADLGRYAAAGALLPRFLVPVGIGAAPVTGLTAFANLFGFLLPQNWLALIAQDRVYKATKYLLLRAALDQYLNAEVQFIRLHRVIQEFEILNFYLVHLQLLSRLYPDFEREAANLRARYASLGTNMAERRGDTKLAFDDLALTMALDKDSLNLFSADRINIGELPHMVHRVKDITKLPEPYNDKERFIEAVLLRSVELQAVAELSAAAALNIGITVAGTLIAYPLPTGRNQFGLGPGFDALPRILIATSQYQTSKINVEEEFINLLNQARRAHDFYTNNLGQYTEGTRNLPANKEAFRINLAAALADPTKLDGLFMTNFTQLVDAEIRISNALHNSMEARAIMRRLLVEKEEHLLDYLPSQRHVQRAAERFRREYSEFDHEVTHLDEVARRIEKTSDLVSFLSGDVLNESGALYHESEENIANTVRINLNHMLSERHFHHKSPAFYRTLKEYCVTTGIDLTADQVKVINHKMSAPFWRRPFLKHGSGPDDPPKYVYEELDAIVESHPKPKSKKHKHHYQVAGHDYFTALRRQLREAS